MAVHAFVDESARERRYLIAAVIVEPAEVSRLRRSMTRFLLPGQRELHFKKEKPTRRRQLAGAIARLPVAAYVYSRTWNGHHEQARQDCMERLVEELLIRRAQRLVMDTRNEQDVNDERTIRRLLGRHPSASALVYEHVDSTTESLLWIADVVAWCHGAGPEWRKRIDPITAAVIDVDRP